jgi:hypothetical protein
MSRQIVLERGDLPTLYGKAARITATHFGTHEHHSILTASLTCEGDGWGANVGGYSLDTPKKDNEGKFLGRVPTAYGLDLLVKIMETVGVSSWEELLGEQVIVLFETPDPWGAQSVGIAHVTDERKVLVLSEHADSWEEER